MKFIGGRTLPILYIVALITLLVVPLGDIHIERVEVSGFRGDYIVHCLVYIPWMLLGKLIFPTKFHTLKWFITGVIFVAVMEFVQCLIPYRGYNTYALNANYFIDQMGEFYKIESECKENKLSDNDTYRRRKTESMPILNNLKRRAEAFLKSEDTLIYSAVNYLLNFWGKLIRYTNEGHHTIDNLATKRSIRPLAVGRNNYIHFESEKSAEMSAVYYLRIEICKMRGVNPCG